MAQLVGLIVSEDDGFRKQIGRLLRSGAVPVSVVDDGAARSGLLKDGITPDVVIVDIRGDAPSAMASIERLRASSPGAGVFAVATSAEPDLILQAMRAGANEFFVLPPAEETFYGAIRRTAARRETTQGARPAATTLVFFGAKGGAGTTTMAVNCGVELARTGKRSTVIVDLKPGLGEVALFLGVKPRYSVLDAIDNLHRLDREFLRELVDQAQVRTRDSRRFGSFRSSRRGRRDRDRRALPTADPAVRIPRHRRREPNQFLHGRGAVRVGSDVPGRQSRRAVAAQRAAAARTGTRTRCGGRTGPAAAQSSSGTLPDSAEADRDGAGASDLPHVSERLQNGLGGAQFRRAACRWRAIRSSPRSSICSRGGCWIPRTSPRRRLRRSATSSDSTRSRPSGNQP